MDYKQHATMKKYGRVWEKINSFTPSFYDWKVIAIEGVGDIWMNNLDGYLVLVESKYIFKSYI
jgi:hypothetical protein